MNKLVLSLAAAGLAAAIPFAAGAATPHQSMYHPDGMVQIIRVPGPYAALPSVDGPSNSDVQAAAARNPAVESALRAQGLTGSAVIDPGTGPGGRTLVYVAG